MSENFKKHFKRFMVKFWKILSNRHFGNFREIFQKIWENIEIFQNFHVFHAYFYILVWHKQYLSCYFNSPHIFLNYLNYYTFEKSKTKNKIVTIIQQNKWKRNIWHTSHVTQQLITVAPAKVSQSYSLSYLGTNRQWIAFGCSSNIRRTAECCLPRLCNKSTLNDGFVLAFAFCAHSGGNPA